MQILFVDDQWLSIEAFHQAVITAYPLDRHTVPHVTTIEAATDILRGPTPPDLIVLDVMFGENDDAGIDFLEQNGAWLITHRIPVLVLTNRRQAEIRTRIDAIRFIQANDDGQPCVDADGHEVIVSYPQNQVQVFQKVLEMMPRRLPVKVQELLALFRPLG